MERVALVNAPWNYIDKSGNRRWGVRAGSRWPFTIDHPGGYKPFPFFLAYATSFIQKHGFKTLFVDSITARHTYEQFFNIIRDFNPHYTVVETSTPSIDNDLLIAKQLRQDIGCKVILTGTHATVFADELIKLPYVYAVLKGEYEQSLLRFLESGETGVYDYFQTKDLDTLPFPYRDDNLMWLYTEKVHGWQTRQVSMMTSRGCPYGCIFCQWPTVMYNKKYRHRSVLNIHEEIEYLIDRFGPDLFIYFDDDTFNLSERRAVFIGRVLSLFGLPWGAMCRIDTMSEEGWKKLVQCGLKSVFIGIETASAQLMNTIDKKLDLEKAEYYINLLKRLGVRVHASFTFGIPGENEADLLLTRNFYSRIKVDSKQESKCIAMPGTKMWEMLGKPGASEYNFDGYASRGASRLE
jgi:radical SAM superfamily enzyme YgiQ (UPF0313 family)